jgi:hypothetical protein
MTLVYVAFAVVFLTSVSAIVFGVTKRKHQIRLVTVAVGVWGMAQSSILTSSLAGHLPKMVAIRLMLCAFAALVVVVLAGLRYYVPAETDRETQETLRTMIEAKQQERVKKTRGRRE